MKKYVVLVLAALWVMPAMAADQAAVTGKWKLVWNVAHGPGLTTPQTMTVLLNVVHKGAQVDGKAAIMLDADKEPPANQDTHPVNGNVDGQTISFAIPPHYESPEFKIRFTGTIDGDTMSGTTDTGDRWTATRVKVGPGGKLLETLKDMHHKKTPS